MLNLYINQIAGQKNAYQKELQFWSDRLSKPKLTSVYLSCLDEVSIKDILDLVEGIKTYFDLDDKTEVTLETDPKGLSLLYLRSLYGAGVNRLSLARPNCDHLLEGFSFFDSVNVDGRLFDNTQHLSRYDLTRYEQFEQVRLALLSQGLICYDRYHFCQPGFACLYLKNVLEYRDYIGIGPNAHSRIQMDGQHYAIEQGYDFSRQERVLSKQDYLEEYVLQNLSLYQGMDISRFENETSCILKESFPADCWQEWIFKGKIYCGEGRMRLMGEMFFTPEKIVSHLIV